MTILKVSNQKALSSMYSPIQKHNALREIFLYQHGYCYIFAIALAHVFDKNITLVWDVDATNDDLEPLYEHCLVHAFITRDNVTALDAGGLHTQIDSLIESYPCNAECRDLVSISRMYRIIEQKKWEKPDDNEVAALINYINSNKEIFS